MRILEADNVAAYLRDRGLIRRDEPVDACTLAGGVSNIVIRCEVPGRPPFIVKQSRPQLRTAEPWFCSPERVWREIDVMRQCADLLADRATSGGRIRVPELLFEDRAEFAFAMSAAPEPHATWKSRLLAGDMAPAIAADCGLLLGTIHAGSWHQPEVAARFDDRQFFDALRLDPYYRFVAARHDDVRAPLEALLAEVWNERHCLVHGDFSPKNLLVWDQGLMLIDFEVGHYGDPAFDLGFFLSHLVLKSLHFTQQEAEQGAGQRAEQRGEKRGELLGLTTSFVNQYQETLAAVAGLGPTGDVIRRTVPHLAACLLARVDGKSKIDYRVDADVVRRLARDLLTSKPATWPEVLGRIELLGRA